MGFRYGSWVMGMSLFFMVFVASRPISLQEKYIEQFKYVAISEMKRTGVPAARSVVTTRSAPGSSRSPW